MTTRRADIPFVSLLLAALATLASCQTPQPDTDTPPAPSVISIIPRSQWTQARITRPAEIYPMNGISFITIHHDKIPSDDLHSMADVAARIEALRLKHVSYPGKPFADIGYHYIIDPVGRVWEGRPVQYQGAHVQDGNAHNLGVLVLGNFNVQSLPEAQSSALIAFLTLQMRTHSIPVQRIHTHQELKTTECPGRSLQTFMREIRKPGGPLAPAAE